MKKDITEINKRVQSTLNFINGLLDEKGYDTDKIRNWDDIIQTSGTNLLIPTSDKNNFSSLCTKILLGKLNDLDKKLPNQKSHTKQMYIYLVGGFNQLLFKPIDTKTKNDKLFDSKIITSIDSFNKKYQQAFNFKQMHYFMALKLNSKSEQDKRLFTQLYKEMIKSFDKAGKNGENELKAARKEYLGILLEYISTKKDGISLTRVIKNNLRTLENLKNSLDLIGKLTKGVKNINTNNLKETFTKVSSFLIDSGLVKVDDLAGEVAKSAAKALLGGGVKTAFAVNDISSYVAGNFLTPNKQYLELNKDGKKVSIKRPPLTLVGIDSNSISNIESFDNSSTFHDKSYNFFNDIAKNNAYLITLDKDYIVEYTPHYDVFLSQIREFQFADMLEKSTFPNNNFLTFDFNVDKLINDKIDDESILETQQTHKNITISTDNMKQVVAQKGKNDLYSFNVMDAWAIKQGGKYIRSTVANKRGLYRESINLKFIQPVVNKTYKDEYIVPDELYTKEQSRKNYFFVATTGKTLGKNIVVEKIKIDGYDWLRIENKNSFDVYFEVEWDYKDNGLLQKDDRETLASDYRINKNSIYLFPLIGLKDDKGHYNDVEFNFYDELAEDFFEHNGISEPRLVNYLKLNNSNAKNILVYNLKLDDLETTDKYLMITSYGNGTETESTLTDKGEVKVTFNMPLSSDSMKEIKVYDYDEKRYLNSDEYSVTRTAKFEYKITINNYENHHEYKLVFPSTLVSENGTKFLDEREIGNIIYYNQSPIANVGEDQTITVSQIEDFIVDGSGSYDPDGTIVKVEWFFENKLVWTGEKFPLKNLSVSVDKYILTLKVTDDEDATSSKDVTITVVANPNTPPTAKAKATPTTIKFGETVTLDASESSDAEDSKDDLTYKWTWETENGTETEDGVSVTVSDLSVGEHTFTLTVTDSKGDSSSVEVKVVVTKDSVDIALTEGLVAHYEFEDNADDSSGNGNDGVAHGGVTYVDGVIGKAGKFDGVDDYVDVVNNATLDKLKNKFTISTWVKDIDAKDSINDDHVVLAKGNVGHIADNTFVIKIDDDKKMFIWLGYGNDKYQIIQTDFIVDTNKFLLYSVVYDGNKIKVYADSKLVIDVETNYSTLVSNGGNLEIGRQSYDDSIGEYQSNWNGLIDDLRIYNRALSEGEIKALYEIGDVVTPTPNKKTMKVAWYINGQNKKVIPDGISGKITQLFTWWGDHSIRVDLNNNGTFDYNFNEDYPSKDVSPEKLNLDFTNGFSLQDYELWNNYWEDPIHGQVKCWAKNSDGTCKYHPYGAGAVFTIDGDNKFECKDNVWKYDGELVNNEEIYCIEYEVEESTLKTTLNYHDDFNDINKSFWNVVRVDGNWKSNTLDYNAVTFENGIIQLYNDRTDDGPVIYSNPLPINKGDIVTIKRKAYVHTSNRHLNGAFNIMATNSDTLDVNNAENLCRISHVDETYQGDWNGFYLDSRSNTDAYITPI